MKQTAFNALDENLQLLEVITDLSTSFCFTLEAIYTDLFIIFKIYA